MDSTSRELATGQKGEFETGGKGPTGAQVHNNIIYVLLIRLYYLYTSLCIHLIKVATSDILH